MDNIFFARSCYFFNFFMREVIVLIKRYRKFNAWRKISELKSKKSVHQKEWWHYDPTKMIRELEELEKRLYVTM